MQITENPGRATVPRPPTTSRAATRAKCPRPWASTKAFSLLELLIVITLIALITALTAPNFSRALAPLQARSSVNKIVAILRYARSQAVSRQHVCMVRFDVPARRVELLGGAAAGGTTGETYLLPEGISLQPTGPDMVAEQSGSFNINFYPGGNSSGGEVTITGKSGRDYRLKVNFITGITEVV